MSTLATATDAALGRTLPDGYELPEPHARRFRLAGASLTLHARAFAQGEVVYLEIQPDSSATRPVRSPVCRFGTYIVRLSRRPWGYRGFFPIHADTTAGPKPFTVDYPLPDTLVRHRFVCTVDSTPFVVSRSSLKVGRFSDVNHARDPTVQQFIARCSRMKQVAFASRGPDLLSSNLAHPRDQHHITSPFWSSRVYERYRMEDGKRVSLPPRRKVHRGLDLRGAEGDPVYAMADGTVVLADSTYYEGWFTVIDHGNRIISYFMHQHSVMVSKGQVVRAGQQVGAVGATGVSTAPHLHVSLKIDGIQVDPLSLLPLPVRD